MLTAGRLVVAEALHNLRPLTLWRHHTTDCSAERSESVGSSRLAALRDGPALADFIRKSHKQQTAHVQVQDSDAAGSTGTQQPLQHGAGKLVYLETYGCQMNVNDTEVVLSILGKGGYRETPDFDAADVVLVNTCAIRENAEARVWGRLAHFKTIKQARRKQNRPGLAVGVLGCMAERLKDKLLDTNRLADIVAGPDAYRDLPRLLDIVQGGDEEAKEGVMNVQLSLEETYADIAPTRREGQRSAFVSIMRGCNNMCAFCIVPYTRGRERSRPVPSIVDEVKRLRDEGVREVTLLGQNVNSYADFSTASTSGRTATPSEPSRGVYAEGFRSVYRPKRDGAVQFADLLDQVAQVDPEMRIRFTSPHPKDFSDDVLEVITSHHNVCKQLHMPAQSGSSSVLERMRRGYTREAYDALVERVRERIPAVALSTDIITGFCGETEEEHAQTVDLLRRTSFDNGFLFAYSDRGKTYAARHYKDDVPEDVKSRRLQEVMAVFKEQQVARNQQELGRIHLVLVEGPSKKSPTSLQGRTCTMKRAVLPLHPIPPSLHATHPFFTPAALSTPSTMLSAASPTPSPTATFCEPQPGDYVAARVVDFSHGTLLMEPVARTSIREFVGAFGSTVPLASFAAQALLGNKCNGPHDMIPDREGGILDGAETAMQQAVGQGR